MMILSLHPVARVAISIGTYALIVLYTLIIAQSPTITVISFTSNHSYVLKKSKKRLRLRARFLVSGAPHEAADLTTGNQLYKIAGCFVRPAGAGAGLFLRGGGGLCWCAVAAPARTAPQTKLQFGIIGCPNKRLCILIRAPQGSARGYR